MSEGKFVIFRVLAAARRAAGWWRCGLIGGLLFLTGCGGGDDLTLTDVSGTVTFAGQPVTYGHIEFVPDSAKGNSGPAGFAEIVDGRYNTMEAGRGVVDGPYLVRLTGLEERPPLSEDETVPSNAKPPLFAGYTIEVESLSSVEDFEVPESARGYGVVSQPSRASRNEP